MTLSSQLNQLILILNFVGLTSFCLRIWSCNGSNWIDILASCTKKTRFGSTYFLPWKFNELIPEKKKLTLLIFWSWRVSQWTPSGPSLLASIRRDFQRWKLAMPQQIAPRLSMDNLVVFSLIMTTYRVPACLTRKVWILLVVCGWRWTWRCGSLVCIW